RMLQCSTGRVYICTPSRSFSRRHGSSAAGAHADDSANRSAAELRMASDAQAEILDLQVIVDAVLGALSPETGRLHAAEWRDLRRDESGIHADYPGFDPLRDAPDAAEVARVEIGGEPERRRVGLGDRVVLVAETENRRDGPERLFPRDQHVARGVGEDGRCEEAPATRMR